MDALEAIRRRRSVRRYTGDPIPRGDLETIVDAGRLAATGGNRQPWAFVVVTERGRPIAKLVPLDREALPLPAHLLALERAGLIKVGTGRIPRDFWRLSRPGDRKGRAVEALLREREEGR